MLRTTFARSIAPVRSPLAILPIPVLQLVSTLPSRCASTSSSSSSSSPPPTPSIRFPNPTRHRYRREVSIPRDLPQLKSRAPVYLAIALTSAITWGAFLLYATNNERANSSIVGSLKFQLKTSPAVREFLGDHVRMVPLFGEFFMVNGSINMLAGKIDVQFRIKGSEAKGIASFTSVRRGKQGRFEVLRWKITREDGAVLNLLTDSETGPLQRAV